MNLRKKIHGHREVEVFTDSLNDILFILLMFFLIVSTLANPNVRQASLPKAKTNTKSKQSVVVTIDPAGHFYIGSNQVDSAKLEELLIPIIEKKKQAGEEATIVINADRNSTIGPFAVVLRVADRLGVKTVMGVDKKGVQ